MNCLSCTATTTGVTLCARCRTTAEVALQIIARSHRELFSLGTPTQVRRRSGPADPTASAVTVRVQDTVEAAAAGTMSMLAAWVDRLLAAKPSLRRPAATVTASTAFLHRHLRTIAVHEWAGDFLRELLATEKRLNHLVSRHQGHWYAGICGARTGTQVDDWCPRDLFVHPGNSFIRCPGCGTYWSVEQRRTQVIEQARETLLPVSVIALAAVTLLDGEPSVQKLENRLRQWVARGQLEDYGVRVLGAGQQPRRVYRLGDVIDRLIGEASGVTT